MYVLISRFWWVHLQNEMKIHLKNWLYMGLSKKRRGLGIKDLENFNKASLAKQLWRVLHQPSSLVAQVLKEKYFMEGNLLEAKLGLNPSYIWESLQSALDLVRQGLKWRVGDGKRIKVWKDRWIPSNSYGLTLSLVKNLHLETNVQLLIDENASKWNDNLVYATFNPDKTLAICCILLRNRGQKINAYGILFSRGTSQLRVPITGTINST